MKLAKYFQVGTVKLKVCGSGIAGYGEYRVSYMEEEPIRDICGLLESAGVKVYPSEPVFEKEWQNTRGLPFLDRILKVKRMFRVSYKTVLYRLAETMKPSDNACTQSCIPAWEFD